MEAGQEPHQLMGEGKTDLFTDDGGYVRAIAGDSEVLIDTRRIATAVRTPLPPEWDRALRLFERRHAPGNPAVEAAVIEALLVRRCIITHEGLPLSVVTRTPSTEAANEIIEPGTQSPSARQRPFN